MPAMPAEPLEDLVWQQIVGYVQSPDAVMRVIRHCLESGKARNYAVEIERAQRRIGELLEAEKKLLRLYADERNRITREAFDSEIEEIIQSREIVERHIRELSEAEASEKLQYKKLEEIGQTLDKLRHAIQIVTPEVKRQVGQNLLQEIRVGRDRKGNPQVTVAFAFSNGDLISPSLYESDVQLLTTRQEVPFDEQRF